MLQLDSILNHQCRSGYHRHSAKRRGNSPRVNQLIPEAWYSIPMIYVFHGPGRRKFDLVLAIASLRESEIYNFSLTVNPPD